MKETSEYLVPINQAKEDYKKSFLGLKGVIEVCASYGWKPFRAQNESVLKVYVDNVDIIKSLPKSFDGYICEYFVCSQGVDVFCD